MVGLRPKLLISAFPINYLVGSLLRVLASADLLLTCPHRSWRAVGSSNLTASGNILFALGRLPLMLHGNNSLTAVCNAVCGAGTHRGQQGTGNPLRGWAPRATCGCYSGQKSRCLPVLYHLLICGSCQHSCWWGCAVNQIWELH